MAKTTEIKINIPNKAIRIIPWLEQKSGIIMLLLLCVISVLTWFYYYQNGLGIAYNDARSHLNIGRRVVEGIKPGLAQIGSVWLPLPHILIAFTAWNDFMWHSGLSGALPSMISFILTGWIIFRYLKELEVPIVPRILSVAIFASNINILYLQSTAMTELLLLATMTVASFELMLWVKSDKMIYLIRSAFWILLSTLVRYDGWFLLIWSSVIVVIQGLKISISKHNFSEFYTNFKQRISRAEGLLILFFTLAGFGIVLWLLWNTLIFKDPLYFALGPFSAKAQQDLLEEAGVLQTKHNLLLSIKFYMYSLVFNSNAFLVFLAVIGAVILWLDNKIPASIRLASTALIAPFVFNVIALYLGHSVLFIQGLSGNTWFNVRYGVMLMPSIAIFIGYLIYKLSNLRWVITGLIFFVIAFSFLSADAVTIDDATIGSSQKDVTEVSIWLRQNAANEKGFVLISAASHDAIIFSSGMPMKRFIHEGTGLYWEAATSIPDKWARWIIMRTYDNNDLSWREVSQTNALEKYNIVGSFPFADIYELKPEYLSTLNYETNLGTQR